MRCIERKAMGGERNGERESKVKKKTKGNRRDENRR